ncbi:MAG: hypothetical protein LBC19_04890, partial [Tannerella sp.]|nr:hypothetical protein [Tannerella sp.]
MKRLFFLLCLLRFVPVEAQNNVFVLVDVSRSVRQHELNNAKQALTEVLTGAQLSRAFISEGTQQDLANFKLNSNDKLSVVKFGSLNTTLAISPNPVTIQNINADVNQAVNAIAWTPSDGQTYITLAKAKIAEYAKNHGISTYKLYIISDNINDDYGPNGRPNYPDDNYTQKLVEGYNTSTNPVGEAGYTKLKFNAQDDFTLSFSPKVDVTGYALPPKPKPPGTIPPVDTVAVIKISSPVGKKNREAEIKNDNVSVSWTCANCPEGIRYTVNVSEYDGGKFRETRKNLTANSTSLKLSGGKYRIMVSASNYSASSDTTYISVSTGGGGGWLVFLLLLAGGGGLGYYFWNKSRQSKIE